MAVSWSDFESAESTMASFGRDRLDGKVAYLATVKIDGTPRVHPVTPALGNGCCFLFLDPSSRKVRDLLQDSRYSLHCAMSDSSGSSGEFQIAGVAERLENQEMRVKAEEVCSFKPSERYLLFELRIEEVVSTLYRGGRADRKIWTTRALGDDGAGATLSPTVS